MDRFQDLIPTKDPKGGATISGPPLPPDAHYHVIKDESYWKRFLTGFNVGHLAIIMGMLGTAVWWFVNYDREITIAKMDVVHLKENQVEIKNHVDNVDNKGTRFSQAGIAEQTKEQNQQNQRLMQLEKVQSDLVPRLQRMTDQVDDIQEWVREQKSKK